jgi:hypothetical protein
MIKINKDLVLIAIIIIAGAGSGYFLYNSQLKGIQKKIQEYNEKIKVAQGELNRKKMMEKEIKDFENQKLTLEAKALKYKDYIPEIIDPALLIKKLEELTKKFNLRELKFEILPGEVSAQSLFKKEFRIYCQGKFIDILDFINALQKSGKYILNIEELDIKRNPEIVPLLETELRISIVQSQIEEPQPPK